MNALALYPGLVGHAKRSVMSKSIHTLE